MNINRCRSFEPNVTQIKHRVKYRDWHEMLSRSIVTTDQLPKHFQLDKNEVEKVIKKYPMRINPYVLSLIKEKDD